jgi:hypothetical protein
MKKFQQKWFEFLKNDRRKKTVQILCGLADGKNWNWTMKFRNNSSQNAIAAIQNVALHKVTSQSEFKIINQ